MASGCENKDLIKDRSFNCGEVGRFARNCTGDSKCFQCSDNGHRSNSMKCPKYRKIVQEMRKAGKRLTDT